MVDVDIGRLHVASVLAFDHGAVLVIKGTEGTARVSVPRDRVEAFGETVEEVGLVYEGYDSGDEDVLIG